MVLLRELHGAAIEERHSLPRQVLRAREALRVEHNLCNEFFVWLGHGNAAEQFLQVVRQIRSAGIPGIHRDKDARVSMYPKISTNQLDLCLIVHYRLSQAKLDVLDLLRNCRENA